MIKIITVLKTGAEYKPDMVKKIQRMCEKHISVPYEFICYSDVDIEGMTIRKLKHNWKGWYSKMEMYQEKGPCLFMDLDTIITNNIDSIIAEAMKNEFVILRDFYRCRKNPNAMQSSIVFWRNDIKDIYDNYSKNPREIHGGDQILIEEHFKGQESKVRYWQDICEGIVSFKANIKRERYPVSKSKIVIFHGKPRPWQQQMIPYA